MGILNRLYRRILAPVYGKIQIDVENEQRERREDIESIRNELGDIHNSIQYFAETMAEKSYLIQCNSDELKQEMFELKRHEIRIQTILNGVSGNSKKVFQVVPVFRIGDAIGDYALFIDKVLRKNGIFTDIYAYQNLSDNKNIKAVDCLMANDSDVIILHMAAENDFAEIMGAYAAKKVLYYHNITPAEFFEEFDSIAEQSTKNGRLQVERLIPVVDCCITDSEYNKTDLKQMGYQCPIYVLPIPFEKKDYDSLENPVVKEMMDDGKTNLIFVGRIAPNKKIEDIIRCYQEYKDNYNQNARLIVVGNYDENGRYYQYLKEQIRNHDDIILTGHVNTEEWITYYRYADIFICMSEHEGYCVPLIEAMSFQIPIVAYNSSAIPETLGEGGVLIAKKDMKCFATTIHKIVSSEEMRTEIQKRQIREMEKYDIKKIEAALKDCISKIMEEYRNDTN